MSTSPEERVHCQGPSLKKDVLSHKKSYPSNHLKCSLGGLSCHTQETSKMRAYARVFLLLPLWSSYPLAQHLPLQLGRW